MLTYALRRVLAVIPVLLGVSIVVFLMISAVPGGPARAILGVFATPEAIRQVTEDFGLDRSLAEQYLAWLGRLLSGDFGRSNVLQRPVAAELADRLPPTLLLAGAAFLVSSIVGLALGVIAAIRQNGWQDRLVSLVALIGISTPPFLLGMLAILTFALQRRWFPVSGMTALGNGGVADLLHHLILPVATLSAVATAVVVKFTRTFMIDALGQDYVRMARAKGLTERDVILRHAFRNALVAAVPVLGLQAGFVFGGAVYVETVFQWPGIGRMLVSAISSRDIVLVQAGTLVVAAAYCLVNLAADLTQAMLDPRIGRS